jgi:hypothetical protein
MPDQPPPVRALDEDAGRQPSESMSHPFIFALSVYRVVAQAD